MSKRPYTNLNYNSNSNHQSNYSNNNYNRNNNRNNNRNYNRNNNNNNRNYNRSNNQYNSRNQYNHQYNNYEPASKRQKMNNNNNNNNLIDNTPLPPREYKFKTQHNVLKSISAPSTDQQMIAKHYNKRRDGSTTIERDNSSISELRKLNNWTKSVLIDMFCHNKSIVLDLAGGKGGDLNKYWIQKIDELILVDHAIDSILDAKERYNGSVDSGRIQFPLKLICADAFGYNIAQSLDKDIYFDLVSSQFAIHYAFETEQRVRAMLTNVTERLREDGYFIGTIPDSNVLVAKWRREKPEKHEFGNTKYNVKFLCDNQRMDKHKILWHDKKNNKQNNTSNTSNSNNNNNKYNITDDKDDNDDNNDTDDEDDDVNNNSNNKVSTSTSTSTTSSSSTPSSTTSSKYEFNPFSIKYMFNLNDAVDCPEYLLHFPTFISIASESPYNLELVLDCNFHEFFARHCNDSKYRRLLSRLGVITFDGATRSMDNHQWDVAYLYKVFAFRKKRADPNKPQKYPIRKTPKVKKITDDDLDVHE